MDAQDLRKLIESSTNKFSIFEDRSTLVQYNFSIQELIDLISDFLSDEQKAQLFELEHFKKLSSNIKVHIIKKSQK